MQVAVLTLTTLISVATLLALAVGTTPEQFSGPDWLRRTIAGRTVLLLINFLGFAVVTCLL